MTDFVLPHPPSSVYDRLVWAPKNVGRLAVTAAGWVRIGDTTDPSHHLHVYDPSADAAARIETGRTNGSALLAFENDARGYQLGISPSDELLIYDEIAVATRITLATDGKVGIGVAPTGTLTLKTASGNTTLDFTDTGGQTWRQTAQSATGNFILRDDTGAANVATFYAGAGADRIVVNASGNVGLAGVTAPGSPLEVALPTNNLEIVDATTSGGTNGTGTLSVKVGGTSRTISFD